MNHYFACKFGLDPRPKYVSYAHFAREPTGDALFFIHGLRGSPTKTWGDFQKLLLDDQHFAGFDIFFFGYKSTARATASANYFRDHLVFICNEPAKFFNLCYSDKPLRSCEEICYSRVIIVGHSLGVPVARRALLLSLREEPQPKWLKNVLLVSFAPADQGSSAPEKLNDSCGLMKNIITIGRLKWAVIDDLRKDSKFLDLLRTGTITALKERPCNGCIGALRARSVIIGQDDTLIDFDEPFCEDPSHEQISNCDHLKVCKPSKSFLDPLKKFEDAIL